MNFNPKVTAYINLASGEQKEILEILRQLIHTSVPKTIEEIKWGMPVFAKSKDFTYFSYSKSHITFGFYNIDRIDDHANILEGEGKTMKHVKIRSKEEIDKKLLTKWLQVISS